MVALAVVLRLTVLPGYMITARPDAVAVVMCTANGAVSQSVRPDQGQPGPDHERGDHPGKTSVCPFATAGVALATPDARIDVAAPRSTTPVSPPLLVGLPGQGLAAPPPPATGPPFRL